MGKKQFCEMAAILLCLGAMLFIAFEGKSASMNHEILKLREKEIVARAVPAMSQSLCQQAKLELDSLYASSNAPTPVLSFLGESLDASLEVVSLHLSQDVIQTVVSHAGFFPSNMMNTLQYLLEYNLNPMTSAVSQLLSSISNSYYTQYHNSRHYTYKEEGDYTALVSQVFSIMTGVQQITDSTDIPRQDSWLGNFFVSIPNITYYTAVNSSSWTAGFTNMCDFARNLGNQQWKGSYFDGNNPDYGRVNWDCPGCNEFFNAWGNQAFILANGAFPSSAVESGNTNGVQAENHLEFQPAAQEN